MSLNESASLNGIKVTTKAEDNAKRFVGGVYQRMAFALLLSFASAYLLVTSGLLISAFQTLGRGFGLIIFGLQFGTIMLFQTQVQSLNQSMVRALFGFYAVLTGVTLATISMIYTLPSIISVLAVSVFGFAALAVYGSMTKRNLGPIGTFCIMGLGMLFAMTLVGVVASLFTSMSSVFPALNFVSGAMGILVFSGLTAWESQKINTMAEGLSSGRAGSSQVDVLVNSAALGMFMNFVGLFISLLRVFGKRR